MRKMMITVTFDFSNFVTPGQNTGHPVLDGDLEDFISNVWKIPCDESDVMSRLETVIGLGHKAEVSYADN